METIKIYEADGTEWWEVKVAVNCKYSDELEGDECVELQWESYDYVRIPVGSYVIYNTRIYRLAEPHEPTRRTESIYTFNPVFYSQPYHWKKAQAVLYEYGSTVTYTDSNNTISATIPTPTSRELDWQFTGNLPDALFMLIQMIKNETGETWTAHYVPEIQNKIIEYSAQGSSLYDFMSKIAEQCGKEFYFDYANATPQVCFGTLELQSTGTHTEDGRVLLYVGDDVSNPSVSSDEENYFTRFYFFGSTRNVDQPNSVTKSSVVNRRLPLCPSLVTATGFTDLNYYPQGFIDIDRTADSYTNRQYIPTLPQYKVYAKSVFFDDIYPHADLKISSVQTRHIAVVDDAGAETGENMPIYFVKLANGDGTAFTFNNGTYPNGDMLPTLVPSIAFRSGFLQGLEYELIYHPTDFTVSTTGTEGTGGRVTISAPCFEIVFDTNSNPRLPNDNIKPQANDQCTLFNIHMPNEYIWNAQRELEQKAIDYINDLNVDKSTYEHQSNPVRFENVTALKELKVGKLVKMLYPNGEVVLSRVIAIEKHLDLPCDCKVTLGYTARQGTIQTLRQIIDDTSENVETIVKTGDKTKAQILGLKNGYLAQKETFDAAFDTDGYFDGSRIKPLTVETNALAVGSRSQQFALSGIDFSVAKYNSGSGVLSWTCNNGKLSHFTIDETCVLQWNIPNGSQSLSLYGTTTESQYIYAKVAKDGFPASATGGIKVNSNNGEFVVTPEQKKFDTDTQYYYFLVGTVSSELTDSDSSYKTRIISLTYGTTTINGKQITTGVIRSSDPSHGVVINLDTGEIIGKIKFLSGGQAVDAEQYIGDTVDDAVSEIEIGGRNLMPNTQTRHFNLYQSATATFTDNVTVSEWNTTEGIRAVGAKGTNNIYGTYQKSVHWSAKQYVVSIYIKNLGQTRVSIYQNGDSTKKCIWEVGEEGRKYFVVTSNNTNANIGFNFIDPDNVSGYAFDFVYWHPKVEEGNIPTDWTPAPEDVDAEIQAVDEGTGYLKQAMADATGTRTEIDGGLLLSSFIGVRNGEGVLEAAMNGISANGLPVIQSGMSQVSGMPLGTFRVMSDGSVRIHKSATEYLLIDKGKIEFYVSGKTRNVITTEAIVGTTGYVGLAYAEYDITNGGTQSGTFSMSTTSKTYQFGKDFTTSSVINRHYENGVATPTFNIASNAITLQESSTITIGKVSNITIGAFTVKIKKTAGTSTLSTATNITVSTGSGETCTGINSATEHYWCAIGLFRDGSSYYSFFSQDIGVIGTSDYTATIPSTTINGCPAGTYKIAILLQYRNDSITATFSSSTRSEPNLAMIKFTSYVSLSAAVSASASITYVAYCDKMYSDGLFLSSANTRWFGVDSNANSTKYGLMAAKSNYTDRPLLHFTCGSNTNSCTTRFSPKGWLQKNGTFDATSAFCRVNMIVLAGDFWYNNGTWSYSIKFNPLGLTISTSHIKEGHFQLTHNIGHTDYFVLGCGFADQSSQGDTATNPNDRGCYVTFYNRTTSTVKIRLADDNSGNNYECYLAIIDFKQYTY